MRLWEDNTPCWNKIKGVTITVTNNVEVQGVYTTLINLLATFLSSTSIPLYFKAAMALKEKLAGPVM